MGPGDDEKDRPLPPLPEWASDLDGVKPLGERERERGRRVRPETQSPAGVRPEGGGAPTRFENPREDEPLLGYAPGTDRATFRRLRAGGYPPERRLDLHGLPRDRARRALRECLLDAHTAGERCVLVVHGRGLGSSEGPILKRALPEWLAEAPVGERVLAFAPARAEQGGPGASYVLLRRSR